MMTEVRDTFGQELASLRRNNEPAVAFVVKAVTETRTGKVDLVQEPEICPRCSAKRIGDLPFCRSCGLRFGSPVDIPADAPVSTATPAAPSSRRNLLILGGAGLIVVVIIAGVALVAVPREPSQADRLAWCAQYRTAVDLEALRLGTYDSIQQDPPNEAYIRACESVYERASKQ